MVRSYPARYQLSEDGVIRPVQALFHLPSLLSYVAYRGLSRTKMQLMNEIGCIVTLYYASGVRYISCTQLIKLQLLNVIGFIVTSYVIPRVSYISCSQLMNDITISRAKRFQLTNMIRCIVTAYVHLVLVISRALG